MPPAAPRRLGGRRRDVAGRGAHVAGRGTGRRDVRSGRRDVRYGGGTGLTLRSRNGHLGGFVAGTPGGAEHVGLGRRVVSGHVGAGHRDRVVLVPGRRIGVVPVVAPVGRLLGDRAACHGCLVLPCHPRRAGLGGRGAGGRGVRRRGIRGRPARRCPVGSGLVGSGLVLLVPLGAAAQRGGHLLEAGHRLGFVGAAFFGFVLGDDFVLWDDVAVYDVAGSSRLAVLVLGHNNHLSRECLKVCGCLPGRIRGPAGVLRGSLIVPCGQVPILGNGVRGDGGRGDGLRGRCGVRFVVGDGVTVDAAVTDGRDTVPGRPALAQAGQV